MRIDGLKLNAIDMCVHRRIPFIAYAFPGDASISIYCNPGIKPIDDIHRNATVRTFDGRHTVRIYDELSYLELLGGINKKDNLLTEEVSAFEKSTEKDEYADKISLLIERLKNRGGKTVFSMVRAKTSVRIDVKIVVSNFFNNFPDTFRFVYYTQETGSWIGATPELLLDYHNNDGVFLTMSLAGTRKFGTLGEWDEKNRDEHDYVTRFIVERLAAYGYKPIVGNAETLPYRNIEHLCHRITVPCGEKDDLYAIMNDLSPTPALCGCPRELAMADIEELEEHQRGCYGGYVAISDDEGLHAYVNLRSAHFSPQGYCIYGGGGVTGQSTPEGEWEEAMQKTNPLVDAFDSACY